MEFPHLDTDRILKENKSVNYSLDLQWKDVKVCGGSKSELIKVIAQIKSQVKEESKIYCKYQLHVG